MKIAVLTQIINRKSGARAPLEIAKALQKEGNDVTIFAFAETFEKEAASELRSFGIKTTLIRANKFIAPFILAKLLKKKFDIISYHAKLPFLIGAKLSGLPMIRTYHGSQFNPISDKRFPKKSNLWTHILNFMANIYIMINETILLRTSEKILAISKYTQEEIRTTYHLKADYIYYGASLAKQAMPKKKKQNKEIIILSVSRIIPYKGFHHLILIFNRLQKIYSNIHLVIAGSSPNTAYLRYLRKIAGKNVRILLNVSDKRLTREYQNANIYATFDKYMFFGMPLLEAAAFSLPIVAINKCAAPEIVQHNKSGFLAEDEKTFEKYLEKLINNSSLRLRMGNKAKQISKKFSWDIFGKKYHRWFYETLKSAQIKKQNAKTRNQMVLITGILLLGFLVRLFFINAHTFWFDEAFSYFVAKQPILSLISLSASDSHPPFYYLFLKLWSQIWHEVWFLRLLSLIFGVASIPIAYSIFKKLTHRQTSLLATLFFALSPLLVYYSVETRMYSLLIFESLLIILFYLKFVESKKKVYLILFSTLGILALHTHYYSILVILSLNIIFFIRFKQYRSYVNAWIIAQASMLITFIPWGIFILQSSKPDCWCFHPFIGIPTLFGSFAVGGVGVITMKNIFLNGTELIQILSAALTIFLFLLFTKGVYYAIKNSKIELLILFFFPLGSISLLGLFLPIFSPRSFIILAPFYYLLVAFGLKSIRTKSIRIAIQLAIFLLISIVVFIQYSDRFFYGPPLEEAALYIKDRYSKQDAIIHPSHITFYSFQYFHAYSFPEFIPRTFDNSIQKYKNLWIVRDSYWTSNDELKEITKTLDHKYVLDNKTLYNTLTLYHYSQK